MRGAVMAAALMLIMLVPGTPAGAAGDITGGTGTLAAAQQTALAEATPSPTPMAQLLDEEGFIEALGIEPPLGEVDGQAVAILHDYYLELSALLDSVREAVTGDELADVAALTALKQATDDMDDELDAFEDTIKATYRAGGLKRSRYELYRAELEYMDDMLDLAENMLEIILGDDWDDWDNWDDWEEDWSDGWTPQSAEELIGWMAGHLTLEYPHEHYKWDD